MKEKFAAYLDRRLGYFYGAKERPARLSRFQRKRDRLDKLLAGLKVSADPHPQKKGGYETDQQVRLGS